MKEKHQPNVARKSEQLLGTLFPRQLNQLVNMLTFIIKEKVKGNWVNY